MAFVNEKLAFALLEVCSYCSAFALWSRRVLALRGDAHGAAVGASEDADAEELEAVPKGLGVEDFRGAC